MRLKGVYPPITTPFDRDGEVDVRALHSNLERYLRTGIAGIVALGTNGEAQLLDEAECDAVVAACREETPTERLLIVGTGRESTRATISAASRAAGLGADAVLVRTPSAFKARMTEEALLTHYTAVADASPVSVILYNFTAATGINISPALVERLSEHPNIAGIKDSNGDVAQVLTLVAQTPPEFAVLVGSAPTFYASLCLGAVGGILALACVLPEACVRLSELVEAQRHDEALALQRRLLPLAQSVTVTHGIPGLKAALDARGFAGGSPRPPLLPVTAEVAAQIRLQIQQIS